MQGPAKTGTGDCKVLEGLLSPCREAGAMWEGEDTWGTRRLGVLSQPSAKQGIPVPPSHMIIPGPTELPVCSDPPRLLPIEAPAKGTEVISARLRASSLNMTKA